MVGARKPWDQAARTSRLSDGCHFRAARPVDALAKWLTKEPLGPMEPGIPPFHSNLDQRLATSRSSILNPGASATSGMSNSMYSALVLIRPSVGWVTLPVVLPEDTVESGWKKPLFSRYSNPAARLRGPAAGFEYLENNGFFIRTPPCPR